MKQMKAIQRISKKSYKSTHYAQKANRKRLKVLLHKALIRLSVKDGIIRCAKMFVKGFQRVISGFPDFGFGLLLPQKNRA